MKAECSNFKHFLKKCLKRYTLWPFFRIKFAVLVSLVWSHVCIIFCNLFLCHKYNCYNPFLVYCRELAPGTVSLTGDQAQGDDSKHDSHFTNELSFLVMFSSV